MQLVVPASAVVPLMGCASEGAWGYKGSGEALSHPSEAFPCSFLRDLVGQGELTVSIWTVSEKMCDSRVSVDEEQEWGDEGHQSMQWLSELR